jgi:hypothetical protein
LDAHKNFAYSTVATAPSPAASGTSLVVAAGQGALFPTVPFNATIWPAGAQPTSATAEIVRVTWISTDTLTFARAQESTSARIVVVGDQIAATITQKTLTDIEAVAPGAMTLLKSGSGSFASTSAANLDTVAIAGLTANDTIIAYVNGRTSGNYAHDPQLYNVTDSVQLTPTGSLQALGTVIYKLTIRQAQQANTEVDGSMSSTGISALGATVATPWTSSWTLALRMPGITNAVTWKWSWAVYKLAGQ